MTAVEVIAVVVGLAPVYAVTVWVLARGAKAWSEALEAVHQARQTETLTDASVSADQALRDVGSVRRRGYYREPTHDELIETIKAERETPSSGDVSSGVHDGRE